MEGSSWPGGGQGLDKLKFGILNAMARLLDCYDGKSLGALGHEVYVQGQRDPSNTRIMKNVQAEWDIW